jgi:hypothetical protein
MAKTWQHIVFHGAVVAVAVVFFLGLSANEATAQCAMCKAVAEDSGSDGYGLALGLNNGIMLLMLVPYILLATLFIAFFGKRILGFLKSFSEIH